MTEGERKTREGKQSDRERDNEKKKNNRLRCIKDRARRVFSQRKQGYTIKLKYLTYALCPHCTT